MLRSWGASAREREGVIPTRRQGVVVACVLTTYFTRVNVEARPELHNLLSSAQVERHGHTLEHAESVNGWASRRFDVKLAPQ